MNKRLSIVIPYYDHDMKVVFNTVYSILSQEYDKKKYEIIIINDGDKKNKKELERMFDGIDTVKLFYNDNPGRNGIAFPINIGAKLAIGEILVINGADVKQVSGTMHKIDMFFKDYKYEDYKDHCRKLSGWIFEDIMIEKYLLNDNEEELYLVATVWSVNEFGERTIQYTGMDRKCGLPFLVALKREVFINKLGGFDEKFEYPGSEDYEFWRRSLCCAKTVFSEKIVGDHQWHDPRSEILETAKMNYNKELVRKRVDKLWERDFSEDSYLANVGEKWGVLNKKINKKRVGVSKNNRIGQYIYPIYNNKEEHDIKFSIIMSYWDKDIDLVERTFYSIINQNYPLDKYEIIFVNDGDETYSRSDFNKLDYLLNKVRSEGVNLKYIFNNNPGFRGVTLANNIGIKNSSGEILIFNSIDVMHLKNTLNLIEEKFDNYKYEDYKDKYKTILNVLIPGLIDDKIIMNDNKEELYLVATVYNLYESGNNFLDKKFIDYIKMLPENVVKDLKKNKYTHLVYAGRKRQIGSPFLVAIKRSVALEIGGFDEDFITNGWDDYWWWRRVLYKAKMIFFDDIVGLHQWHKRNRDLTQSVMNNNLIIVSKKLKELLATGIGYKVNDGVEWGVIDNVRPLPSPIDDVIPDGIHIDYE